MIIDEEHISHYGVKGMRWGKRKSSDSSGSSSPRTGKQKAAIATVATVAGVANMRFIGKQTMSVPLALAAGAATARIGQLVTRQYFDNKMSEVRRANNGRN